jgi:hypothetical protein
MYHASANVQPNPLFGPYYGKEHEKKLAVLQNEWPHTFRENVFPHIPGDEVAKRLFALNNGRPSKDVNVSIALMILQDGFNLTDQEAVHNLTFNGMYQYALHLDNNADEYVYMSRRTFWGFKEKVREKNLDPAIFDNLTRKLAETYDVDTSHVRLDSVHFMTNMKLLSRGGIFFKTTGRFLWNLRKVNPEAFSGIDDKLTSKYLKDRSGYDVFGHSRPSERATVIKTLAADMLLLVRTFENDEKVSAMRSYRLLVRVLDEQCVIQPASDTQPIEIAELKDPSEVPSDSLQNPSDPDASYSGHKGTGMHAQIAETFDPEGRVGAEKKLQLIMHTSVEGAHKHDGEAVKAVIDDLEKKGVTPSVIVADTAYGGDENVEYAAARGIELLSPVPGNKKGSRDDSSPVSPEAGETREPKDISLADFKKNEDGKIISCPSGQKAETGVNRKGTGYVSVFDFNTCLGCPRRDKCPVKIGKRKASILYNEKMLRIAERRKHQDTPEFKSMYRMRSGVEATNSVLVRKHGLKRLRVRGSKKANHCIACKAIVCNVLRIVAHKRRQKKKLTKF